MNRHAIPVLVLAALGSFAQAADSPEVGISVGLRHLRNAEIEGLNNDGPDIQVDLDVGLNPTFSATASAHWAQLGTDSSVPDITDDGPTFMGLGISLRTYALGRDHRVVPYVSAGVGAELVRWEGTVVGSDGSETTLQAHLGAGLRFRVGARTQVFTEVNHDFVFAEKVIPTMLEFWRFRGGVQFGWK